MTANHAGPASNPRPYAGKRAFDIALVVVSAPVWLVAVGVIAVLVRARIGAPVFFRQERPGRNERSFHLVKFRTMTDAQAPDGSLLPDNERLTPFGSFLRSTSLDELPELINVLRGDMSLVGPRPLLVRYLPLYSVTHQLRHSVRPGVTGLAQISGRNALDWSARFDLDVQYARSNSIRLDVWILWRTVRTVLRRDGIAEEGEATMSPFNGYEPAGTLTDRTAIRGHDGESRDPSSRSV